MRRSLPWVAGAALVLAAGAVSALTPSEDALLDPFRIRGADGDPVRSRALVAQLQDATFADRVTVEDDDWDAEGNWLVVTLRASAPHTEDDAAIGLATLTIDGTVFEASERPSTSLVDEDLHVGTDTTGMLAFELPAGLSSGTAELRLATEFYTPELDDVISIPILLDDLATAGSVEIVEPTLGSP